MKSGRWTVQRVVDGRWYYFAGQNRELGANRWESNFLSAVRLSSKEQAKALAIAAGGFIRRVSD